MSELPIGTLLQSGKFKVDSILGQGGFGITYRAIDSTLNRQVAIKEYFPRDWCQRSGYDVVPQSGEEIEFATWQSRFRDEAQIIAKFHKPQIVTIHEVFDQFNTTYYVMELLDGKDAYISVASKGSSLPQDYVIQIATSLGDALDEVHRYNLLHRDVHPKNIIITKSRIVLIDFGLAITSLRTPGQHTVGGYPAFRAPEMLSPDTELSPRTDIYSLGASIYYLISGKLPAPAHSRLGGTKLAPPHIVNGAVNEHISDVIMRAMALEPIQRHASAGEFASSLLESVQGNVALVRPRPSKSPQAQIAPTPSGALPQQLTKEDYQVIGKGIAVGAVTVAGLAVVAGGIWAWMENLEQKAPSDQSEADQRLSAGLDHLLASYPELSQVVLDDQDLSYKAITSRLNQALPREQQLLDFYERALSSARRTARWGGTPFTKFSCLGWMTIMIVHIAALIMWQDLASSIRAAAICFVVAWFLWAAIALLASGGRGANSIAVRLSQGVRDSQREKVSHIRNLIGIQKKYHSASQWRSFKYAVSAAFKGKPGPNP